MVSFLHFSFIGHKPPSFLPNIIMYWCKYRKIQHIKIYLFFQEIFSFQTVCLLCHHLAGCPSMLQKELYLHGLTRFQHQICHKATVILKKPMKKKVSWQITFQTTLVDFPLIQLIIEIGLAHGLIMTITRETCTRRILRKLCQQLFLLNKSDTNLDVQMRLSWQQAVEPIC